jgi:hypothetical protein
MIAKTILFDSLELEKTTCQTERTRPISTPESQIGIKRQQRLQAYSVKALSPLLKWH